MLWSTVEFQFFYSISWFPAQQVSDVFFMTFNVALKDDGYSFEVSHPTNDTIVDVLQDWIWYEKL